MWKIKVFIQFILGLLPGGERINYVLQCLCQSHSPESIAEHIVKRAEKIPIIAKHIDFEGITVVEIGTGWEFINPLLFYFMGVKTCYTFDHLRHVRFDMVKEVIRQMEKQIDQLRSMLSLPKNLFMDKLMRLKAANTLEQILEETNIVYVAPSDATRTDLPDKSIDLVFSHGVLEHVPENVLKDFMLETKRILKKNGIAYHLIGTHDHYAGFDKNISKVNFLQYPEWLWALFVKNKISYHNRLREKQFLDIFSSYGANIEWINSKIDPSDLEVLKTMKIDKRFAGMTYKELAVYYSELILSFL